MNFETVEIFENFSQAGYVTLLLQLFNLEQDGAF
jgi:hypothetical protein